MSSQIVFLFDLDQCLPLEKGLNCDDLEFLSAKVKDVCLKILTSSSHLDGPNGELKNVAHFSFRFYSSTEYFMVPDQHDGNFKELSDETFDSLDSALSDRFEALLQTSKTNSFDPNGLLQHMSATGHKAQYLTLQKALEEIAILYNWDRPLMHSPVKMNGKNNCLNAVYVFTKLPNSNEELCQFMGKPKMKRRFGHKDIYDRVFNTNRSVINIFKGDALININIVDTAQFREVKYLAEDYFRVKNEFKKCLFQLHGNVIPIEAFRSKNCVKNYQTPHPTSAILSAYSELTKDQSKSKFTIEISLKSSRLKLNCSESIEEDFFTLVKFVKIRSTFFSSYQKSLLLWPSESNVFALSHFMIKQGFAAILRTEDKKMAILTVQEESLFTLSIAKKSVVSLLFDEIQSAPASSVDLQNLFKEKQVKRRNSGGAPVSFFKGSIFESSTLSDSAPFSKYISRMKQVKTTETELMLDLKKSYLPHRIEKAEQIAIRRKTSSEESVSSNKSTKSRSRGAELMRLGSKNAELRRNSHEEFKEGKSVIVKPSGNGDDSSKESWKGKFLARLANTGQSGDDKSLLAKLIDIQLEMLDHGENTALVAFAQVVSSQLLEQANRVKTECSFDDLISQNFLVDPCVVSKRKPNKNVRIRDHKLQVLFRIEFHFFLPNQERQQQVEEGMLAHLRQISIWDSPNEMLTFLQEIITHFYINRQPELLCFLYEELNQPPPPGLSALFSPFKRCSEAASSPLGDPSSIKSDVSYISNPSWKNKSSSAMIHDNHNQMMRKVLRRPQNFTKQTLQIDLEAGKKAKKIQATKISKKTPKKTPKKSKKTPVKCVRRNLSFESSPRKTPSKKGLKTPKKTPKKSASKTPCKMTPGKKHQIFVPETPTGKNGRRKSDGTQVVKESPNIDALKQEVCLRNRTSFYSGEVSRNLLAAEELIDARKLQNFNTSLPLKLNNAMLENRSQLLFPHMQQKRQRRISRKESKTPQKAVEKSPSKHETPQKEKSMRRLFEDTDDVEITLKSPFKVPPSSAARSLFSPLKNSPVKTPRKKSVSKDPISPVKSSPIKTTRSRIKSSSKTKEELLSPVKNSPIKTPKSSTKKTKDDIFNDLLSGRGVLQTPPQPSKTYSKEATPSQQEIQVSTPESRPSRRKKIVERMGIEDVKLSEVYSPRVCITPFQKHRHRFVEDEPLDEEPLEGIDFLPKEKKRFKLSMSFPKEVPAIVDLPKKRKRSETEEKFSYDIKAVESPNGEFKLKINRTLKPLNSGAFAQRISRRASQQLGLTPDNLLKLQTKSPSPLKKVKDKENLQATSKFSPLSSTSLFNLTTSPILNVNLQKERRPSKDSPSRKRRRVSKKLYD